ncbi:protein-S-isoprenylcysteine O-methyltransferase B [Hibiscus syriacus]|uniref:Protein-S-isoprenylcysteine O-methyltransferase B n=1 Tax=Hibiscus syriacus TaxID=106335 RepID=A0A6A2WL10_HIBSY|nr:protein-S-isoprenylcysteine O-methyltransferase B [Hibiscus syriacus]
MKAVPKQITMAMKSYKDQAHMLVKNYLLADPFVPYTSILSGMLASKLVYDLTDLISSFYIKTYPSITKIQRWHSTTHAIFISTLSLYFVFLSDLFSDPKLLGLIVFRSSTLSTFGLGWHIQCLPEKPTCIHTWFLYLRYLDTAGMKNSIAYLINGIVIFIGWLVLEPLNKAEESYGSQIERVLLFGYMFYHVYLHYDQVMKMHTFGYILVFGVRSALGILNMMRFGKIIRGLLKTLAKRGSPTKEVDGEH